MADFRPNAKRKPGRDHEINQAIRDREIRLIGENGEQLGIVSAAEGNRIADEQNLDLVKISPSAVPPVCKLMDYGKYCFELSKKEKEARKNQTVIEVKEIRLSITIDDNDMKTKAKHAQKFIESGCKVKVSIRMRSRQNMHPEFGFKVMNIFFDMLGGIAKKDDKGIILEGRNIIMMLSPLKSK